MRKAHMYSFETDGDTSRVRPSVSRRSGAAAVSEFSFSDLASKADAAGPDRLKGATARVADAAERAGARFFSLRKVIVLVMVAACLVGAIVLLYAPVKQYYHAVRVHDRAAAELAALDERNAQLQASVDALSTDAGVEDVAREKYGWVIEGENAVNVYGLDSSTSESDVAGSIPAGSVQAPVTWYSVILDPLFGE